MANSIGALKESIWRDRDFRALPRTAQATYAQLISQKELDRAGMLPLLVPKWVKGCDDFSEEEFWQDLEVLQARRFVFFDSDTDELFVRSYMRTCEVVRYPNILKNALRCAGMVASERLRFELAQELRRLGRAEASRVADEIEPEGFENRSETLSPSSETVPEPLNRSETIPEPQGMGTGTGKRSVSSLVTFREGDGANSAEVKDPQPFCDQHPGGTPEPCGPCAGARKRWLALKLERDERAEQEAAQRAEDARRRTQQEAEDRAAAIDRCDMCRDTGGYVGTVVCDHDPDRFDRAQRHIAAIKAKLAGQKAVQA